ncbi:MAG: hypothetical protein WCX97_01885 [Candidatus Magasanikbacteria bacterium]|jgi:hypothetical protein
MPINILKENVNLGKIMFQWSIKEYEKFERERSWYILVAIIGIALLSYAIIVANYLFALILVLLGIISFLHEMQDPMDVPFAITEIGIVLGGKFYRYSEIKNFWIIYNPPEVKKLYFSTDAVLRGVIQVPLLDYDPRPIRQFLSQYLLEDLTQEEEPLGDMIARRWQIH